MKWIKLFEDANKMYWAMEESDFFDGNRLTTFKTIPFSENELMDLNGIAKKYSIPGIVWKSFKELYGKRFFIFRNLKRCIMYKSTDEWYYIYYSTGREDTTGKYYKCDQFDGLVECAESLLKLGS